MKYPKETLAKSSSGKLEARVLVEKGKYVRYTYVYPETGKEVKKGKESIWLKSDSGRTEHLFFIPMKDKSLVIRKVESPSGRKIWDAKKKKIINIF